MTKLYLLSPPKKSFIDNLGSVLEAGVDWFQYRRPGLGDEETYQELRTVRTITSQQDTNLIVNNRPDMALAVEADGVHLGDQDLPVQAVKDQWPHLTVGRTTRPGEVLNPEADYYGVGPTFETNSKNIDCETFGWRGIGEVLTETNKPVFAIGGIDENNLEGMPNDLEGIALISAVWESDDLVQKVKGLRLKLDERD